MNLRAEARQYHLKIDEHVLFWLDATSDSIFNAYGALDKSIEETSTKKEFKLWEVLMTRDLITITQWALRGNIHAQQAIKNYQQLTA